MIDFGVFAQIRKNALESITSDSDKENIGDKKQKFIFVVIFYVFPICCALTPWLLNVGISRFDSFIATAISIFTGLFFSLLLNISSRIRIEKENKDIDLNNFERYKENMKQISNITQYVVVQGIVIMLFILFRYLFSFENDLIIHTIDSIVIFVLIRYFLCLLFMLQRFYFVLRDEIDNII